MWRSDDSKQIRSHQSKILNFFSLAVDVVDFSEGDWFIVSGDPGPAAGDSVMVVPFARTYLNFSCKLGGNSYGFISKVAYQAQSCEGLCYVCCRSRHRLEKWAYRNVVPSLRLCELVFYCLVLLVMCSCHVLAGEAREALVNDVSIINLWYPPIFHGLHSKPWLQASDQAFFGRNLEGNLSLIVSGEVAGVSVLASGGK